MKHNHLLNVVFSHNYTIHSAIICLCGILMASIPPALANGSSRWEVGVGATAISHPYYRGSAENDSFLTPLVIPIYRGTFIEIDDQGVRGKLLEGPKWKLDFSVDANLAAKSDDIVIRSGMPDLETTLELGPALQYQLVENESTMTRWVLNLPLRSVFQPFAEFASTGYRFSPHITYYQNLDWLNRTWILGLSGGMEFADERYHDYYYQVSNEYSHSSRAAYDAQSGFGGARYIATLHGRKENVWISFFLRYDDLDGAVFSNSPLLKNPDSLTVGLAFIKYIFSSTNKTVE